MHSSRRVAVPPIGFIAMGIAVGTATDIFDVGVFKASTSKEYSVGAAETEVRVASAAGTKLNLVVGEATFSQRIDHFHSDFKAAGPDAGANGGLQTTRFDPKGRALSDRCADDVLCSSSPAGVDCCDGRDPWIPE